MSKSTNPSEQLARFKEIARQLGADEALDRAMDKLDLRAKPKPESEPDKAKKGG